MHRYSSRMSGAEKLWPHRKCATQTPTTIHSLHRVVFRTLADSNTGLKRENKKVPREVLVESSVPRPPSTPHLPQLYYLLPIPCPPSTTSTSSVSAPYRRVF